MLASQMKRFSILEEMERLSLGQQAPPASKQQTINSFFTPIVPTLTPTCQNTTPTCQNTTPIVPTLPPTCQNTTPCLLYTSDAADE